MRGQRDGLVAAVPDALGDDGQGSAGRRGDRWRGTGPTRRALVLAAVAALPVACGSRTGLLSGGAGRPVFDEADASDAGTEADGSFVPPDGPDICPNAGSTLIYLIASDNTLMSFYPPTATITRIGRINCPDPTGSPFSMAVDRQGTAYVVFRPNGNLFKVSTRTAVCGKTAFVPGNAGFPLLFGMGFSADTGGGGSSETLYLAGDPASDAGFGTQPGQLGWLDVSTFTTHPVGTVAPAIHAAELTGTGGGDLYGFYGVVQGSGAAAIVQIDKATAHVLSSTSLPSVDVENGWAFAFWGGDFYTFTAPGGMDTTVQRYHPVDGSVDLVATLTGAQVVGAGVSTCAPM